MKKIFIFLISLLYNLLSGQNLLYNPDFEDYSQCPTDIKYENEIVEIIPFWTCPSRGTPDYFNKCASSNVSIPDNFAGTSNSISGNGYLGLILCGTDKDYREYVQGKLIKSLLKNQDYCIELTYRLASLSKFSVNQLGIYISTDSLYFNTRSVLKFKPQLNWDLIISKDWVTLKGIYPARGGENYIVIGNFNDTLSNKLTTLNENILNRRGKEYAYIYLDNLSLKTIPRLTINDFMTDSVNNNLIDINGEVLKFVRNSESRILLRSNRFIYEFFLADLQIDYSIVETSRIRLKCKDLSNCIKCSSPSNLDYLSVLDLNFNDQSDANLLYEKIKK